MGHLVTVTLMTPGERDGENGIDRVGSRAWGREECGSCLHSIRTPGVNPSSTGTHLPIQPTPAADLTGEERWIPRATCVHQRRMTGPIHRKVLHPGALTPF